MIFNTFNTLNLALVSLLSIGLTAFGQPFDSKAPEKPGSALSSDADTPAWITSINKAEVKTRDLQARTVNFISPRMRPTFDVVLNSDGDEIYSVIWTFDMWVENQNGWASVKAGRSIIQSKAKDSQGKAKDFTNVHLSLPGFKIHKTGDDFVRGTVTLHLTGYLHRSDFVLDLQVHVWGSKTYTTVIHDHDVRGSTATLRGRNILVDDWDYVLPSK